MHVSFSLNMTWADRFPERQCKLLQKPWEGTVSICWWQGRGSVRKSFTEEIPLNWALKDKKDFSNYLLAGDLHLPFLSFLNMFFFLFKNFYWHTVDLQWLTTLGVSSPAFSVASLTCPHPPQPHSNHVIFAKEFRPCLLCSSSPVTSKGTESEI